MIILHKGIRDSINQCFYRSMFRYFNVSIVLCSDRSMFLSFNVSINQSLLPGTRDCLLVCYRTPLKSHTNPRNLFQQFIIAFTSFLLSFKFFIIKLCMKIGQKEQNGGAFFSATKNRNTFYFWYDGQNTHTDTLSWADFENLT